MFQYYSRFRPVSLSASLKQNVQLPAYLKIAISAHEKTVGNTSRAEKGDWKRVQLSIVLCQ